METDRNQEPAAPQEERGARGRAHKPGCHQRGRMHARLQTLEAKVQTLQQSGTGSTVDTEFGGRKPALIMGGWGDDTLAEETLRGVQQMIKDASMSKPSSRGSAQPMPSCRTGPGKTSQPRTCERDCRGHSVGSDKPTSQWGPTRRGRPATFGCNFRSPLIGVDCGEMQKTLLELRGRPQPDRDGMADDQSVLSHHHQAGGSPRSRGRMDGSTSRPSPGSSANQRAMWTASGGLSARPCAEGQSLLKAQENTGMRPLS